MMFLKEMVSDITWLVELVKGMALLAAAFILLGVGAGIAIGSCLAVIKFLIGG